MASKGSKRATSSLPVPATKKAKASPKKATQASPKKTATKKVAETIPKVESVFAGILTALDNADHLPERCREMMAAMVEPCLSTPKSDRHAAQALGVTMIEETLQEIKAKQMVVIEQVQKEWSELEASKEGRQAKVTQAQTDLESKEATEKSKQGARDEAESRVREAETTLADAKLTELKGKEPLEKLETEKATLEKISEEHVKAPMRADQGPHFDEIEPHIATLGLDESLSIALPSSCAKTKDQRGGFDEVVLGELEKALDSKIVSLTNAIAEEVPKAAERKAAVASAEASLEEKANAAKVAVSELEAAKATRLESAASLAKANEELESLAPSIQETTSKLEELKSVLSNFEAGPLATFISYQNKVTSSEEAAPAGA